MHFGLKCDDDWQANHYPLSQTGPEKTEFPIEIVSGTEAVKAFWGSVSEGLDYVMSQLKEAADLSLSQLRELRSWMKEAVEHSVVNVYENRVDLGAEIGETLLALISGALMGIDNAFNVPTDAMDEFFSSHALAYNIGKVLEKSGTIARLSLLAGLFLRGGAALALGGAMVVVSSFVIAIEWSALIAGSLSLSVSDHSSGNGEVEEGESETGESLWKPTENKNNLWNKGKLKKHYDKHGGDFGAKSAQEYSDMAVEFGTRNSDDIVQTIHEGYVYRYEPSTNTVFVRTAKGGKVKSFYVWDGRENDLVINTLRDLDLIP